MSESDVVATKDQVDDTWKYLKEGMVCSMVLFNNNPITVSAPNHCLLYTSPSPRDS